jgi:3-mercaptopyruvate sulfurtransferase SseA
LRGQIFENHLRKHILPVVIDTRPWWIRKAYGEIPVAEGLNYNDLFESDPLGSGALVLKHPIELHEIFEMYEGIRIRGHYKARGTKIEKDTKEVIFTCQSGVSACAGYFALTRVL